MTGSCAHCGQQQALHMMTWRRMLHEDRHTGVGRPELYCSRCQQRWLEREAMAATELERPRRGRHG